MVAETGKLTKLFEISHQNFEADSADYKIQDHRRRCTEMGKNQHVVPVDDRWGVKGEGNSRMTKTFDTQKEAIAAARIIAKKQESELIIHNKEGQDSRKRFIWQ